MEYILIGKKKLIVERETVSTDPCKIYKHDEDGCFYQFINEIYDESEARKPGFYLLDENFIIVPYTGKQKKYTEEDVKKEETNKLAGILKGIKTTEKKVPVAVPAASTSYNNPFAKTSSRTRSSNSSDILSYVIDDDDDDMVRVLKETINEKHITMNDLYSRFGQGKGWNLIYGLRMRHTISLACFNEWAEVLDMEVKITLTDRQ